MTHTNQFDVAVIGAGSSGISAAIAAARLGARVSLIESCDRPGGTVTNALVHTLGGIFDSKGELIESKNDILGELMDRLMARDQRIRKRQIGKCFVLDVCPTTYQETVDAWLKSEPNIEVRCDHRLVAAERSEQSVERIQLQDPTSRDWIEVATAVDCTGLASLIKRLAPEDVFDRDFHVAGGWVFVLRGTSENALGFPNNMKILRRLRKAVSRGDLTPECRFTWFDQGIDKGEVYMKLFVPMNANGQPLSDCEQQRQTMKTAAERILDIVRAYPGFESAFIFRQGDLGVRDSGGIRGEYFLTADEIRSGCRFEDSLGKCAWPMEFWDPIDGAQVEYLPNLLSYDIPLRSLKSRTFDNVWFAGRCFSADALTRSSARVVGTCWSMGHAAGHAAGCAVTEGQSLLK